MNTPDTAARRAELYSVLGILPPRDLPVSCDLVATEETEDFILERLVLSVCPGTPENPFGEPIPALFVHPKAPGPYPAVLFNHSHGGYFDKGKEELLSPKPYMYPVPYARELTRRGYAALAIDHFCFGERQGPNQESLFKELLWKGRCLWGHMVYDSLKALDYLVSRPDVDASRVGTLGMSMGSAMTQWVAALDERVKACADICCITDFDAIIEQHDLPGHGIYYFVPNLMLHFTAGEINALIAPRPHLSTVGVYDSLTPIRGVDRIEAHVKEVYASMGVPDNVRVLRYPNDHLEPAAMRRDVLRFMQEYL